MQKKIVRKQVLWAREHSRESLLQKVKSESDQKKLTFNITYYLVFQDARNILQELHILLTPDQEHKTVFQDNAVVRFRNGKSLKDPNLETKGRFESCGKENCQLCDFICDTGTFTTTKTWGKIQSGILIF